MRTLAIDDDDRSLFDKTDETSRDPGSDVRPFDLHSHNNDHRIRRLKRLGDLLDTRFKLPVVGWRIGMDGLIGLVPGVGDTISGGISAYIIYEAHRAGARKRAIGRMAANALADYVLGIIPLVGDVFDFAFKANAKNVRLLLDDIEAQRLRANYRQDGDTERSQIRRG